MRNGVGGSHRFTSLIKLTFYHKWEKKSTLMSADGIEWKNVPRKSISNENHTHQTAHSHIIIFNIGRVLIACTAAVIACRWKWYCSTIQTYMRLFRYHIIYHLKWSHFRIGNDNVCYCYRCRFHRHHHHLAHQNKWYGDGALQWIQKPWYAMVKGFYSKLNGIDSFWNLLW